MARMKNVVTLEEKKALVGMAKDNGITLNGEPAQLVNVTNKFPTVRTIRNDGPAHEYSWKAVRNVMYERNGAFAS